jgi:hypothetical protein
MPTGCPISHVLCQRWAFDFQPLTFAQASQLSLPANPPFPTARANPSNCWRVAHISAYVVTLKTRIHFQSWGAPSLRLCAGQAFRGVRKMGPYSKKQIYPPAKGLISLDRPHISKIARCGAQSKPCPFLNRKISSGENRRQTERLPHTRIPKN